MSGSNCGLVFLVFSLYVGVQVAVAQVTGYYGAGCYLDTGYTGAVRPLPVNLGPATTVQVCANLALNARYQAFAVQDGSTCFATNSTASAVRDGLITSTATTGNTCWRACPAEPGTVCGGPWANSLYFFKNYNYVGCFRDDLATTGGPRALEQVLIANDNCMSVEKCAAAAKVRRLRFFGLQNGNYCFATNSSTTATAQGPIADCILKCTGNQNQWCGGYWRNTVYEHRLF
eukprot:TRINITY_DN2150_c0_g1_i1.p2 TRINITY_DN2150_c0_g1~~TRINITY_DN2150_c0_g1_i1.p2  ORF type:complete len:247 (+),score=4.43 TRINITY_DN2150_c0_g1_i1:50-742(+)